MIAGRYGRSWCMATRVQCNARSVLAVGNVLSQQCLKGLGIASAHSGREHPRPSDDVYRFNKSQDTRVRSDRTSINDYHHNDDNSDRLTSTQNVHKQGLSRPNRATTQTAPVMANLARSVLNSSREKSREVYEQSQILLDSLKERGTDIPQNYTSFIRIAIAAGKLQEAFDTLKEMKNRGIAPDLYVYRAFFEGLQASGAVPVGDRRMSAQLRNLFDDMINDWRNATNKIKSGGQSLDENESESVDLSQDDAHLDFILRPSDFINNLGHYIHYLITHDRLTKATAILLSGLELAKEDTTQTLIPHLPCILSTRYANSLYFEAVVDHRKIQDGLRIAFETVVRSIFDANIRHHLALHFHPYATSEIGSQNRKRREQFSVDLCLSNVLSALFKLQLAGKAELAIESLQAIYQDEYLASLPAIVGEKALRNAVEFCKVDEPKLCFTIYEKGVEHHKRMELLTSNERSVIENESVAFYLHRRIKADPRNALALFTNVLECALFQFDDLEKGFSVLEQVKHFKRSTGRLSVDKMPYPSIMRVFMRKIDEKNDWQAGQKLLEYHLDDSKESRRGKDPTNYLSFVTHFLNLAIRSEREQLQIKKSTTEDMPIQVAMKYLVNEVGAQDEVWKWCQEVLNQGNGPSSRSNESNDSLTKMIKDFLAAVVTASEMALGGRIGDIDLSIIPDVDLCTQLLQRGSQSISV